jgi:hypothetical protein
MELYLYLLEIVVEGRGHLIPLYAVDETNAMEKPRGRVRCGPNETMSPNQHNFEYSTFHTGFKRFMIDYQEEY